MVFVKPTARPNPPYNKLPPFLKGCESPEDIERMRNVVRWHNEYGSKASDMRDRRRHFAIAKSIENHYGQG